ncbi:hypothetical protein EFR00_17535 [Rhizobium sophoriradicis]|uniref:hypothetical protein n=1 Tax=Rhizobium sophoriradicis TaxID=1535245 RepID=UPI00098F60E5|nr:hypothetical protein [Rhizobium sophoriradicis]RSC01898.1 hypothetical protein EFR00_17535 [Rhizobium sophoriradicis]
MAKQFTVPSLAKADVEYGGLEAKLSELSGDSQGTATAIADLIADIEARPAPRIRVDVAALLGETIDQTLSERPEKLRALRRHAEAVDAAIVEVRQRLRDRTGTASKKACDLVRIEYGRRIDALVSALDAVQAARLHADALLDDLESEGVQLTYLPALRPIFLGDKNDGHIHRFKREAMEAGYVN